MKVEELLNILEQLDGDHPVHTKGGEKISSATKVRLVKTWVSAPWASAPEGEYVKVVIE